jgi:hypothetical protein
MRHQWDKPHTEFERACKRCGAVIRKYAGSGQYQFWPSGLNSHPVRWLDRVPECEPQRASAPERTTVTPATREWCVARDHPWVTYHPQADLSYCRCGERQEKGEQPMDRDAKWSVFHDHPPGAPCRCYLPKK